MADRDLREEVLVKVGPSLMTPGGLLLLTLDASITQSHNYTAQVTVHPVEDGADVADHIRMEPVKVAVNGIVTATRLGQQGDTSREIDAWNTLEGLVQAKQPITLVTSLRTYTNMVLVSLSTSREKSLAHAIAPQLEFQQIRVVKSAVVTLPPEKIKKAPAKAGAPAQKDAGKQATGPTSAEINAKIGSFARALKLLLAGAP